MNEEHFFTVKAETERTTAITCRATVPAAYLTLHVRSARVAAADELYSARKNAVEETCRWCLEAHDIDTRHAGDFCPFSQKEPCIVQKWKDTLKRAGKEPMNYYVKLTKLNRRRK